MSGENTTLKVTIIGDSRSAQRAVSGLGKSSDGLLGKLGGFAGTVGTAFGGAALVVGGLGIAAGAMGLEVAAGNEQAQISFTTMLGSGKKAASFLQDLQKFAAATPFEFPELQTAASSLISAGIQADKVIPIMTTLGDVTSGMGTGSEGVKRATVALQQMSAAGKITGEDLNQLRDAGIPVYDLLSKATGKSKAEVVKLAQAGKLGSKELGQMMKALETGKGMERFSGLMKKQSASLTGMWSTVKDTLGQGLAKAITPLIPLIKDGLGKASEFLAGVLPKVSAGLQAAVKWVTAFVKEFQAGVGAGGRFREILTQVWGALVTLFNIGKSVTGWMLDHKGVVIGLAAAVGALVVITKIHAAVMKVQAAGGLLSMIKGTQLVTGLTRAWAAVQWLMNAALSANPIGLVVVAIALLAAGLVYAYKHSETFRRICDEAFKGVGTVVQWLWEHWVRPFFKFFFGAIQILAEGWAIMLDLLGNVPGFGWAKDAAAKIRGASAAVKSFSDGLDHIDPYVPVNVVTTFSYKGYSASLQKHADDTMSRKGIRGTATGRTGMPSGLSWIGERGPELMYVPGGSSIYNARESARMAAGGGGGSSTPDGGISVYVTVAGSVTAERDLAISIRNELVKIGKRNGGVIFPK